MVPSTLCHACSTPHASEDRKDSASGNEDSQPAHQAASWHADTSDRQSAAETSTSQQNTDHASQAMHEEVQELAEPKALKAEAASQQQVKQYADQLAEQYE